MKTTLVTVTYPENRAELIACVQTMRAKCRERLDWIIITEAAHVAEIASIVPGERVVSMDFDARLEAIPLGYARQNAAKLLAVKLVSEGMVVFIDDDTTAVKPWGSHTFIDDNGKPVVHYWRTTHFHWMFGQMAVFGRRCDRLFQLRLPLAMTAETLREIAGSRWGHAAMERWKAGDMTVSEFCVMGEASLRIPACRDAMRETYRNNEIARDHWTIDLGIFHDWQADRRELRAAIARGEL